MKTQTLMQVNPRKSAILDLDDFTSQMFFYANKHSLAIAASKVLSKVLNEGLKDEDRDIMMEDINMKKTAYYNLLGRLIALGLIYKKDRVYRPSQRFVIHLRALASYWEAQTQRATKSSSSGNT